MTVVKIGVSTNRMTDYTPMAYGLNYEEFRRPENDGLTSRAESQRELDVTFALSAPARC